MKTIFALLTLLAIATSAFADGGTLLQRWDHPAATVFLFGSPSPLRAGPAELEILVQDAKTGVPRLDGTVRVLIENADVTASAEAWVPPCCRQHVPQGNRWEVTAAPSTHGNRLCFAAPTIFPAAGKYRITVAWNEGETAGTTELTAEKALPPVVEYWPLIGLPFLVTGLFLVNRVAARHRRPD